MADHPDVQSFGCWRRLERALQDLSCRMLPDKTGALDVFFATPDGRFTSEVQSQQISQDFGAICRFSKGPCRGQLGTGHAVMSIDGRRTYFFAAPVFVDNVVAGVVLVAVADVEDVEQTWRGSLPAVFFTNGDRQIFISNRPELLFWHRSSDARKLYDEATGLRLAFVFRRLVRMNLWMSSFNPYLPETALHQAVNLPVLGLVGEILVDVAPAHRIGAVAGGNLVGDVSGIWRDVVFGDRAADAAWRGPI